MSAAAVIVIARRKVAEHLLDAGATSAESAVTYQPARHVRRRGLRYLTQHGVVTLTQDGRYWIDEEKYREYRSSLRRRIGIIVGGALAVSAAIFAFGR